MPMPEALDFALPDDLYLSCRNSQIDASLLYPVRRLFPKRNKANSVSRQSYPVVLAALSYPIIVSSRYPAKRKEPIKKRKKEHKAQGTRAYRDN